MIRLSDLAKSCALVPRIPLRTASNQPLPQKYFYSCLLSLSQGKEREGVGRGEGYCICNDKTKDIQSIKALSLKKFLKAEDYILPYIQNQDIIRSEYIFKQYVKGVTKKMGPPETLKCSKSEMLQPRKLKLNQPV